MINNLFSNAGDIVRDVGLIPGLERSPGGGLGNTQGFLSGDPMDRRAWQAQSIG